MIVLQILPATAQGETPPTVEITISDSPSNEDANWPIIKKETHRRNDPSTGHEIVETTVIKKEPPTKDKKACKDRHENGTEQFGVAVATCIVNRYSVVQQAQVSVGGGSVTGHVKNIADEYCSSVGGCGFYKMKRLDVWWTRTSTNFGVINATRTWGCVGGSCALCNGSTTGFSWRDPTSFNPIWNGLTSKIYTRTSSTMPIMRAMPEYGGFPVGDSNSVVTAPRSQTPLAVYTMFYDPY